MKAKIITADLEKEVIELYLNQNLGAKIVGKRLGIGSNTVRKILNRHNIKMRNTGSRIDLNQDTIKQIIYLCETEKLGLDTIGKKFNVSFSVIKKILDNYNIKRRVIRNLTIEEEKELVNDYVVKRLSVKTLRRKFHISAKKLYDTLTKYNVEIIKIIKALVTPELEKRIVKLYTIDKLSVENISKEENLSKTTTKNILIKHNVPIHQTETFLTEHDEQEIIKMYENMGKTPILKKFKISEDKLFRILEKYHIERHGKYELYDATPEEENIIVKLYKNPKCGINCISEELGISIKSIIHVLNKHNIKLKNTGNRRDFALEEELNIVKMYEKDKLSMIEIWRQLEIPPKNISDILIKHGVEKDFAYPSMRTYEIDLSYWEKIDRHDKGYHLGLMYADGNNDKNLMYFGISLHEKDIELLERFKKSLRSEHPLAYKENDKQFKLLVGSTKMSADLSNLGCFPNKSLTLKFPTEEQVPRKFINSFILGSFDGDGSIFCRKHSKNSYGYGIAIISSIEFIQGLQKVIQEETGLFLKYRIVNYGRNASIYTYDYNTIAKLMTWLYRDCGEYKLSRKYNRFQQMLNNRKDGFIKYKIFYPKSGRIMK